MRENKIFHPGSVDDERLHGQFTAYFITALKRSKTKYLMKRAHDQRHLVSLDELLEQQEDELPVLQPASATTYPAEATFTENVLEDIICNDRLLVAVLKLSDRERKILNLHLLHKMQHGEIAAILSLRKNTVEQCYARLIRKLRADMEGGSGE